MDGSGHLHAVPPRSDLAALLAEAAHRLAAMPAALASSISVTAERDGRSASEVERLARDIARRSGHGVRVAFEGAEVSVTFRREGDR